MTVEFPVSHRDLIEQPICPTMVTVMPDGTLHATVVWWRYDDGYFYVAMGADSVKVRNLRANPKTAFTVLDPKNPYRYLEVRGEAVEIADGGHDWLDETSVFYTGKKYYGVHEPEDSRSDPMILVKIKPTRIRANG